MNIYPNIIAINTIDTVGLVLNIAIEGVVVVVLIIVVFSIVVLAVVSETNLIKPQKIRAPAFLFKQEIELIEKEIPISYPVTALSLTPVVPPSSLIACMTIVRLMIDCVILYN